MGELARRTTVDIVYEGKNITKEISKDLISFSFKDNMNSCDEIAVTLLDSDNKWLTDWVSSKGDEIKATIIKYENEKKTIMNCGTFFLDDKDYGESEYTFKAISVDITSTLKNEAKTKVWNKTSLKKITEAIAKDEKLSFKFTGNDCEIVLAEQKDQSNGGFLQQICLMHGFAVKISNKTLYVTGLKELEKYTTELVIDREKCKEWKINDTDNDTYDKCLIEYKDHTLGKKVKGEASISRPGYKANTGKTLKFNQSFGVKGASVEEVNKQLNKIAEGKLREKTQEEITLSISYIGNFDIVSGRTLTLKNFGQYDKYKFVISSAEHKVQKGHTVNFEARRCLNI